MEWDATGIGTKINHLNTKKHRERETERKIERETEKETLARTLSTLARTLSKGGGGEQTNHIETQKQYRQQKQ